MFSSGWTAVFLTAASMAFSGAVSLAVSWKLTSYKIRKLEESQGRFEQTNQQIFGALDSLKDTIRESVNGAVKEFKQMLYHPVGGKPFYQYVEDCKQCRTDCQGDFDDRLKSLESKAHSHDGGNLQ